MALPLDQLNALLAARGIAGFGQRTPAPAQATQTKPRGLADLFRMYAMKALADQRGTPAPTMADVINTPIGQRWTPPAPAPVVPPSQAAPMPWPQQPRAAPQPFVSQFDWSKFSNTGQG